VPVLEPEADEVVCVRTPETFFAVGFWYERFGAPAEHEIRRMLADSPAAPSPSR
jgi:predicted phosphoribosyltransferase